MATWKQKMDDIHKKITDGYRRGICNKSGESVKREDGSVMAKPGNAKGPRSLDPTDTFLERHRKGLIVI